MKRIFHHQTPKLNQMVAANISNIVGKKMTSTTRSFYLDNFIKYANLFYCYLNVPFLPVLAVFFFYLETIGDRFEVQVNEGQHDKNYEGTTLPKLLWETIRIEILA